MKKFNQAIIFGGAGFIGKHMRACLRQTLPEMKVYVADLAVPTNTDLERKVDVRKKIEISGDFGPDTVIFNFAAIHRTPGHPDHAYFETNISGAENVCEFATRQGIQDIVFTSSIAPYGASEDLKTEKSLPMPNTPYGISKLVAEKIHETWLAGDAKRSLHIVRPGIVFGTGEHGNMTRLYKALRSHRFAYAGRKDTLKANIYVKDLTQVMLAMAESGDHLQLFNCCSYPAQTIEEIVNDMLLATNMKRHVPYIPQRPLMIAAGGAVLLGGLGLGICPARVRKLMVSTNVSGQKLSETYPLHYSLKSAFEDWFKDCKEKGLE